MEKAILVTVDLKNERDWPVEDRAAELRELVVSSRVFIESEIACRRERPTPDLFIGKGKFNELRKIADSKKIDVVIFNNDLTPTQLRNLEAGLGNIKVIDRTQLILDIFSQHAKSMEGKIQVELAQLEYLLPRLTGRGVYMSRLGGGIGTRGPGEKILEYDRRKISHKISKLRSELRDLEKRRYALRNKRKDAMLTSIAIVGYTNAGKTTLLNRLTDSKRLVADKLFSTLDPVARSYTLPNNLKVLFHDTVGFLHKLPHNLIESFKATLEEIKNADLLIHVLDASNPRIHEIDRAVHEVLKELDSGNKTIISVLNKKDLVDSADYIRRLEKRFSDSVAVSALKDIDIGLLIDKILALLADLVTYIRIEIPINRMDLVNMIYSQGKVHKRQNTFNSVLIEATIPTRIKKLF